MKRLINNIFTYIKLVISHYKIKIKYITHDKFDDKVEEYSKMYNQVLSDINPAYLEEFNAAVDKNYLDIFEKYLNDKYLNDLLRYEVEIDYYKKFSSDINYNRGYNDKFSYSKVRSHIDKLYNNKYPDGFGNFEDNDLEKQRVVNKIMLYMRASDRYPFMNQYIFYDFQEKISNAKLEIYNYLLIINNDNIVELVQKLIRDLLDNEISLYEQLNRKMYSVRNLDQTASGLRFKDVNPKNIIKPTSWQKVKTFYDSLIYVKRDFKILKRFVLPHFVGKIHESSKLNWINNLLVYIQYLFNGSLFRNYRKLKKYNNLLSNYKHINSSRKKDLKLKMMKSLELNDRLVNKGR